MIASHTYLSNHTALGFNSCLLSLRNPPWDSLIVFKIIDSVFLCGVETELDDISLAFTTILSSVKVCHLLTSLTRSPRLLQTKVRAFKMTDSVERIELDWSIGFMPSLF
jgi:hypothetical protein